jgi:hypothetical protein
MSEIAQSTVGVMQRFLLDEFKSIPPELVTPISRVDHLAKSVLSSREMLLRLGEDFPNKTTHALDDLQFIAAGAMRYAKSALPDEPNEALISLVARSSPRLVFPTHLSDGRWQDIRKRYSEPGSSDYWRLHLSPELLFHMVDASTSNSVISYTSSALLDMDTFINPSGVSGCPARGIVVQRSLSFFVEAVYGSTQDINTDIDVKNSPTNQLLGAQLSQVDA